MAKPQVVIVGADKGGVGKTTVSRILLDFYEDRGVRTRAFDTETPVGVLKRFNSAVTEIVDLTHTDGQVAVFDNLHVAPVTLIDIRAGLLSPSLKLLGELGFLSMSREGKLDVKVLHVIGSTVASFNEIAATAAALGDAKHYVVTNHINDASFFEGLAVSKEGSTRLRSSTFRSWTSGQWSTSRRPACRSTRSARTTINRSSSAGRSVTGWLACSRNSTRATWSRPDPWPTRWRTAGCPDPASG
jgi:hypothetical protein